MSAEIPPAWGQAYPRAVGLPPDGFLVPAGTLRALLTGKGQLELIYTGFALAPTLRNGALFRVEACGSPPAPGDLVLCEAEGWGEVRRVVGSAAAAAWVTALDALPRGREIVPAVRILGRITRPSARFPAVTAKLFPVWSRAAALLYWRRRILEAPAFGDRAVSSVREKYAGQVGSYSAMTSHPLGDALRALIRRSTPEGGSILIAGCGAGSEAMHLCREGYRVSGFDYLAAMVQEARRGAAEAGLSIDYFEADMATLDLGDRRFNGIYVTPLVYSFQPGRARRVECLRRLGRHLSPGGRLIYSAERARGLVRFLELAAAWWVRRRATGEGGEFGDWYTWFLTPHGRIGKSFIHLFTPWSLLEEAREAGLRNIEFDHTTHHIAAGVGAI